MADATTIVAQTNQNIIGSFTGGGTNWINVFGWIIFIIVLCGLGWWFYIWSKDKKTYIKRITAMDRIGVYWEPVYRDVAKTIKIGKGGFEVLYLKKAKTWKLAYGGRVGRNDYYFFIMPDGYWYNGMMYADVNKIDEQKGLIPIVTTNPLMRAQYTALEKQVDALHGEKGSWWEKHGSWVLAIGFVLISGVMLWLSYKEFAQVSGNLAGAIKEMSNVLEQLSNLAGNIDASTKTQGLLPV